MSRSGYSDDCENYGLWRGAVLRAINGKRGQAFLCEMLAALDALPEPRLASGILVADGECCAMGAVAMKRGADVAGVDEYDRDSVADVMGISPALAAEIAYVNDEGWYGRPETPEERFARVRRWVAAQIRGGGGNE